ncbi:hypothetical protein VWX96_17040 [Phaeobacter sp. A90a-4f]|uniref:hypothetical protein n=1 Tax=Phaeobacter TaxID=302485 RepID=UPI0021A6C433|nr:hypothetical protein [Phaeobacter inhibens]UWR41566.1 hypothetical protein K4F85_01280 [Phaeobacter inhibens]
MDITKPLKRWEPDPDVPCPSDYPWQAHRPEDMDAEFSNVTCPGTDGIIACRLPNKVAMAIADHHNGMFTEHATDKTSRIHD